MVATERPRHNRRKSLGTRIMDLLSGSSVVFQSPIASGHWETVKKCVRDVNALNRVEASFTKLIDGMHGVPYHGKRNVRDHYFSAREAYRDEAYVVLRFTGLDAYIGVGSVKNPNGSGYTEHAYVKPGYSVRIEERPDLDPKVIVYKLSSEACNIQQKSGPPVNIL